MNNPPTRSRAALCALALLSVSLASCAELDLGPEPSTYVGPSQNGAPPSAVIPADNAPTQPATHPSTQAATQAATQLDTQPFVSGEPLPLTLQDALLATLQNNPGLKVQRFNPQISRTAEERQRAAFDPLLTGQVSAGRVGGSGSGDTTHVDTLNATGGYNQFLPTGTTIAADGTVNYSIDSFYTDAGRDSSSLATTSGTLTITQALLRGGDMQANLASLREAQVDTRISQYELRGFAESLLASVESAYWDYALSVRQLEIFSASLKVAEEQLSQTNEMIKVGRMADVERAAAEAEVALRREALIAAKAALERNRLTLLRLLAPTVAADSPYWNRQIILGDRPIIPPGGLDPVDAHVQVALALRPDLNQARLQLQRGDLEIVRTKNGLLPRLDLFVTLGKTGYANSFGASLENLNGPNYQALVGLKAEYPVGNRAAKANYQQARLSKDQALESLNNLTLLAQVDVRSSYVDVTSAREQITATAATRIAQEAAYRAEAEKFRVGRSTALLVAQSQRDLVQAQIAEVQAVAAYLKSLITLYQTEGSLLERRHIAAPGRQPVAVRSK